MSRVYRQNPWFPLLVHTNLHISVSNSGDFAALLAQLKASAVQDPERAMNYSSLHTCSKKKFTGTESVAALVCWSWCYSAGDGKYFTPHAKHAWFISSKTNKLTLGCGNWTKFLKLCQSVPNCPDPHSNFSNPSQGKIPGFYHDLLKEKAHNCHKTHSDELAHHALMNQSQL